MTSFKIIETGKKHSVIRINGIKGIVDNRILKNLKKGN